MCNLNICKLSLSPLFTSRGLDLQIIKPPNHRICVNNLVSFMYGLIICAHYLLVLSINCHVIGQNLASSPQTPQKAPFV